MQQGQRVYPDESGTLYLSPGDYGQDAKGKWFVNLPTDRVLPLTLHVVTENEDGTISVSPSILEPTTLYHGNLINGVWHAR